MGSLGSVKPMVDVEESVKYSKEKRIAINLRSGCGIMVVRVYSKVLFDWVLNIFNVKWFSWKDIYNENTICKHKKFGGLGFRDIIWNLAAIGQLVCHIGCGKDDLWVHNIYLNDVSWRDYQAPMGASWILKQICKAKNKLQHLGMQQWYINSKYSISKVYERLVGTKTRFLGMLASGIELLFLNIAL